MSCIFFLDTELPKIPAGGNLQASRRQEADMDGRRPGRPAKYTEEFKANAVDYYLQSGKTQRECADDLGVPHRTIGKWIQARGLTDDERSQAAEVRALRKEVERLRMENEFLKKRPPSSPRTRGSRALPPDRGGGGLLPRRGDVPHAGRAALEIGLATLNGTVS